MRLLEKGMGNKERLRTLWLQASAPYRVLDEAGKEKLEQMGDGRMEPIVELHRLAIDLTVFVIENNLNNRRPLAYNTVRYWRDIGRVSTRISNTIEAFIQHQQKAA